MGTRRDGGSPLTCFQGMLAVHSSSGHSQGSLQGQAGSQSVRAGGAASMCWACCCPGPWLLVSCSQLPPACDSSAAPPAKACSLPGEPGSAVHLPPGCSPAMASQSWTAATCTGRAGGKRKRGAALAEQPLDLDTMSLKRICSVANARSNKRTDHTEKVPACYRLRWLPELTCPLHCAVRPT